MLIRSQDKKILVDMNTVIIHIFDRDIACYAPSCISDDGFLYLGSYETEEKSFKGTRYDSGSLWGFGIHKIYNSRSM